MSRTLKDLNCLVSKFHKKNNSKNFYKGHSAQCYNSQFASFSVQEVIIGHLQILMSAITGAHIDNQ